MKRPMTLCAALLLLSACAGETTNASAPGGRAGSGGTARSGAYPPGSQEDFTQYAGDRIARLQCVLPARGGFR